MSLRFKIALSLLLVGTGLTAIVGTYSYQTTSDRLLEEVDRSMSDVVHLVVSPADFPVGPLGAPPPPPPRGAPQLPSFLIPSDDQMLDDIYWVRVLDEEGAELISTFRVAIDDVDEQAARAMQVSGDTVRATLESTANDESFRIHSVVAADGRTVQVVRALEETNSVLADLRLRTVALVVLAAWVSAIVGVIIASQVAAPLRRLAAVAEKVGSTGRLDVMVPKHDSADEVGKLRLAFSSMMDSLARSRADQERLVQDAGHELRTPLTSLRTNVEVLRRHESMDPEMRATIVDEMNTEVAELTDLVNELVTAAAGGLGDQPPERVDLTTLARLAAERVGRRHGRQVSVNIGEGADVEVTANASGLERSVVNLIENACKFDLDGRNVEVTVDFTAAASTGDGVSHAAPTPADDPRRWVSFSVSDDGPGIPPEDVPFVFDRFHRSEDARSLPGSGLGLSIVSSVILDAGGRVHAMNRPGGGANVGFDLPVAERSGAAAFVDGVRRRL